MLIMTRTMIIMMMTTTTMMMMMMMMIIIIIIIIIIINSIRKALGIETTDKWCTHVPKPVYEEGDVTVL